MFFYQLKITVISGGQIGCHQHYLVGQGLYAIAVRTDEFKYIRIFLWGMMLLPVVNSSGNKTEVLIKVEASIHT